ncbi:hypothetical protein BN1044_04334 [Hafnia alvei]|uniref:Uncharacterized protein n=1 Tax=Hafnia alvei TaxID=569 RepID=A0A1C6Z6R6_HAFAL|nr:hypothetical protein BN1044_04334 [Hafnia alvei]
MGLVLYLPLAFVLQPKGDWLSIKKQFVHQSEFPALSMP